MVWDDFIAKQQEAYNKDITENLDDSEFDIKYGFPENYSNL